jgi:hypothetical protein
MIEKFCEHLTSTYNTNILDYEDKSVQDEFLKFSLKNRNNKGFKNVLMELICNHYDKRVKKPNAEFIGGPKTLSIHWHPVYKKMIYIFGEWHSNNVDCDKFEKDPNTILIEDYLYNLMLTTDVFLDIYFEFLSYKNGEYERLLYVPGRTNELFKKFRKCLQYNTRSDASCQLARVHYFDIRGNDIYEKNPVIDIFWVIEQLRSYTDKKTIEEACSSFKLLLTKYPEVIILLKELQKNKKIVCKFIEKQLEENPYIKKELDKIIDHPELKMLILNFYKKLVSEQLVNYYDILQIISLDLVNYEKTPNDVLVKSMKYISLFLMKVMSYFTDVYLLARMFKTFDMSEMEEKAYKGSTDQPIHANNIIIYCGNMHSIKYREFLSSIGFNDIDHVGNLTEDITNPIPNTPKNCLDMRKIKQPFFSYSSEELIKKSARLEREQIEREQIQREQLEQKQREYKKIESERIEREQKQKEFWQKIKEKREKEKLEKEQKQRYRNQKIKEREDRERLEKEQKQKEQDEYEVPEEPCSAILATPQPPICWDTKTMFKYHPDRNIGCPKTAKDLFQKYQALDLPKKCSETYPGQKTEREIKTLIPPSPEDKIPHEDDEDYSQLLSLQTINIQKRCCDRPTQFPSRMANCEGSGHTTAARLSYFASFLTNQDSNLDAIIEITNSSTEEKDISIVNGIEYLDNKKTYISDHNGIVLSLSNGINFNIISSNLEGLCRQTEHDSHNRIKMITNYFKNVIIKGSILVCQEIVLQKLAKARLPKELGIGETEWVDVVGNEILSKLKSINNNLVFLSDKYTGGIFYDSSIWKLENTINIPRLYDKKTWAKFSNAYLFKCISTELSFWVVNIHLKAFAPGSIEHTKDLLNTNKYVNRAHIIELENIISKIILESKYFKTPIYLCGDYNNKSPKDALVQEAIKKYMDVYYPHYIVKVI